MNLTIFGLSLGTLPGWVPVWAVPAAMIHIALFLALIIPTWVALARARSGGPLALVLILPVLGLLMLCPIFMNRVLPYAHWARFWGILVLIPGLNIFFLWIFAFAPWKRRYIPLDQEEYSEPVTGMGPRKQAPKLDGRTGDPATQGGSQTMMPGAPAKAYSGEPGAQTMFPGAPTPRTGTPLSPRSAEPSPQTMMAGPTNAGRSPSVPSGPPADEPPQGTIIAGGRRQQPLDEPVQPRPPIPARSRDPLSSAPTGAPPQAPPPIPEPPRQRPERTQDLTARNQPPPEAATVRIPQATRAGGRVWKLIGSNDVAKAIEFTIQEAALLESEAGLLVGRSARANFVIDHDSISRNHARFTLERGTLMLEDLDSMNGTWVDGNRLEANEPVALQPNGIVEIGKVALRVTGG